MLVAVEVRGQINPKRSVAEMGRIRMACVPDQAAGFLLKDLLAEDLVDAIRHAARGSDALLAPAVTRRLVERFAQRRPPVKTSVRVADELTPRELEVLRLVASGLSNSEIARELYVGARLSIHMSLAF